MTITTSDTMIEMHATGIGGMKMKTGLTATTCTRDTESIVAFPGPVVEIGRNIGGGALITLNLIYARLAFCRGSVLVKHAIHGRAMEILEASRNFVAAISVE